MFYRKRHPIRAFKSAGEKEKWKISMKLQSRYQGPYMITGRINAVLYEALINGVKCRVHAVNMKPARNKKMDIKIEPKARTKKINIVSCSRTRAGAVGGTTGKKKSVSLKSNSKAIEEVLKLNKSSVVVSEVGLSPEQAWEEMTAHRSIDEDGEIIIGPWGREDMKRWGLSRVINKEEAENTNLKIEVELGI
jgi:hypothetical protein